MAIQHYINHFLFLLILSSIQYSSPQIFITPIGGDIGTPTIISRQTITVQSNDGTPVTITKINIRPGRNINGGSNRLTPFDLMRLADSRINDFFEAIISRQIQLFNAIEHEEEKREKENKEKEVQKENENYYKEEIPKDNNQNENKNNTIDDKEFELDEKDDNQNNKDNNDNINEDNNNKNNGTTEENKKSNENDNDKISNKNKNKKKIGKLYVDEEVLKKGNKANNVRKNRKKLTRKEIIFSRVCKYIFYSIILFTFYILIKKLLEILDIIDPESSEKNVDINIKNIENKNEETKEKVESEVIVNKERENKQN